MSELYWLGANTQTTACVCYRATANGTVAVTCDGRTFTADADTDVLDGVVRIDVTGLRAGQDYAYSISQGGAVKGAGTLSTIPADGEAWSVAFLSCWRHDIQSGEWVAEAIADHSPPVKLVMLIGDCPYMDIPFTERELYGITRLGLSDYIRSRIVATAGGTTANYDYDDADERALILRNYYDGQRSFRAAPGVRDIIRRYATIWQGDDHEVPGNDANREEAPVGDLVNERAAISANATQTGKIFDICRLGMQPYYIGNPSNADADNDGSYADDRQSYFRLPASVDLELFCLDTTNYKTTSADAAGARKIVGDTQRAWLVGRVAASEATFKVISSPATLAGVWATAAQENGVHPQTADGNDIGERDTMMKALDDEVGVVFVAGDLHHTHVSIHNGIACVDVSPVASTNSTAKNYNDGKVYARNGVLNGNDGAAGNWNGQLGFVDVAADKLTVRRFSLYDRGGEFTVGEIAAGSNTLTHSAARVA